MFIDSHAHLHYPELAPRRDDVLRKARHFGVIGMLNVGTDLDSSRQCVAEAGREPNVFPTVGIHPHSTLAMDDAGWAELEAMARRPQVVAIGECGLDYFKSFSPPDVQREAFRRQVRLARELDKPLIVHNREADDDCLKWIKEEGGGRVKGVLHCFASTLETAQAAIDLGFYISFSGIVTFPRNERLREIAAGIPLDRLLLETDCPYLAPQPKRGQTNEPAFMRYTALELCKVRKISMDQLARATSDNTRKLFKIETVQPRVIAYVINNTLYVNLTQRCPTDCAFCPRDTAPIVQGHNLKLEQEPAVEEILADVGDPAGYDEVVFCGYGESTMRLDALKQVARQLKAKGAKTRLNTIGLGDLVNGHPIAPELAGAIDAVSVSLNTVDPQQYEKLCRPAPEYKGKAWQATVDFIQSARQHIKDVQVSVVTVPTVDVEAARKFAESMGAKFLARPYNELG